MSFLVLECCESSLIHWSIVLNTQFIQRNNLFFLVLICRKTRVWPHLPSPVSWIQQRAAPVFWKQSSSMVCLLCFPGFLFCPCRPSQSPLLPVSPTRLPNGGFLCALALLLSDSAILCLRLLFLPTVWNAISVLMAPQMLSPLSPPVMSYFHTIPLEHTLLFPTLGTLDLLSPVSKTLFKSFPSPSFIILKLTSSESLSLSTLST